MRIKVGDLVYIKVPSRKRTKDQPYWDNIARITERVGAKTYYVYDGERVSLQHVDNLKTFSIAEDVLKNLQVNPEFIGEAEQQIGAVDEFDRIHNDFEEFDANQIPSTDQDIWVGFPGLDQMEKVVAFIKEKKYRSLVLVIPDLTCTSWYNNLDQIEYARWYGAPPNHDIAFWIDHKNRPTIQPGLTWWLIRFVT